MVCVYLLVLLVSSYCSFVFAFVSHHESPEKDKVYKLCNK